MNIEITESGDSMADITNIANVTQYTYTVNGTEKPINTPISSKVTNTFSDPQVIFSKVCTPAYGDLGDVITITYTVKNIDNQTGSPVINSILIKDPFLTENIPFIDITIGSNVIDYNQTAGTFNILLPGGSLVPGGTDAVATFTYIVSPGFDFTTNLATTATASFNLSPSGTLANQFSTCGSGIQNGTLTMIKTVSPTTSVSSGSVLAYTIFITNTGNVTTTIPANMFVDPIPAGSEYIPNTISPVDHITYNSNLNAIVNADPLEIRANSAPYTITFNVRVL